MTTTSPNLLPSPSAPSSPPRHVIFTADDFGRSPEINAAVLRAHRDGLLTSASLMAGGDAFDEAVAIARAHPSLSVGLHLALTAGKSVLPVCRIPDLVDYRGRFRLSPRQASLRLTLSRHARWQMVREIRAQFEKFLATGLPLAHVDGHQQMHCHPALFRTLVPLAEEYGARAVRIPRDQLLLSLRHDPLHGLSSLSSAFTYARLARRCRQRLADSPLLFPRRVFGLLQSGRMTWPYLAAVLRRVRFSPTEIYFHPTLGPRLEPLGPNPADLDLLCSPELPKLLSALNLLPSSYASFPSPSPLPS